MTVIDNCILKNYHFTFLKGRFHLLCSTILIAFKLTHGLWEYYYLCTEILIYDSYWEITSKDFFKTVRLTNDHKICPLSVLWRCPFYREFHYGNSYTKMIGACEKCPFYRGVRLTEMFVSRELI